MNNISRDTTSIYESHLKEVGHPLFIPFTVLGDPDKTTSLAVIKTLIDNGADALELGMPFSDPPADGPVIQAADTRALASGMSTKDCFEILQDIRALTNMPISLLVYYNLILQFGIDNFYNNCAECGVNSVLAADLPLEHLDEILPTTKKYNIATIMLISELTTDERMEKIAQISEGFLYLVSYLGVTGVENAVLENTIEQNIKRARRFSSLPIFVGFGISTPAQAKAAIVAGADGVIIGSRIVKDIPDLKKIASTCKELKKEVTSSSNQK